MKLPVNLSKVTFEWDPEKNRLNFQKHGVRFQAAVKVFFDPDILVLEDHDHAGELRYDIIGAAGKILFVVCTVRWGNTIRIISARAATRTEKEFYYDYQNPC